MNILVECRVDGDHIYLSDEDLITIARGDAGILTLIDYQRHIDQLIWLSDSRKGFVFIESMLLLKSSGMTSGELQTSGRMVNQFYLNATSIFPEYVSLIRTKKFKDSLDSICSRCIPIHVNHQISFSDCKHISEIVSDFVVWHNAINADANSKIDGQRYARSLIDLIVKPHSMNSIEGAS